MSDIFLPTTRLVPQQGDDPFLSPEEQAFQQRMFRNVQSLPQEFWTAVIQKVALDGEPVPQSQVQGLLHYVAQNDTIVAAESTSSTSYTDLSTVGPQVTKLSDGFYIVWIGCDIAVAAGRTGYMSVGVNDTAASDNDNASFASGVGIGGNLSAAVSRAGLQELRNNNNNTITAKYKASGGSATFADRWMTILKVGN